MNQSSDQRLRAILLGAGGRPDIVAEAERLWPVIEQHAAIVLADFAGSEDLARFPADLAVVFGGDGSILRAARQMGHRQLPIVAVNMGRLGYLANIATDELATVLADYRAGKLKVAEHLMFECSLIREKKPVRKQLGLNEVSVLAGMPFSQITLNLYVDSELATTYSGDGLIIATPVGSTAHSLSAGGPILRQSMNAFVVVPISPHTLTNRPVVDAADRVYELEVVHPNPGTAAVIDGKVFAALLQGDRLRIEASNSRFQLITGKGHGYYRTLREKLGWGGQLKRMTKSEIRMPKK
ncbi:MAG: NAD(+)/NADH kinase [Pirellulales bacterium]|nr:NAD(+)/NADH kinase [Pirellulales bacterium]